METIQPIGKIPALARITEIQQRIKEIEKSFGFKIPSNDFQTVLENAMANQTKKIKPIEEFLAENQLPPVSEKPTANLNENANVPVNENTYLPVDRQTVTPPVKENLTVDNVREIPEFGGIPVQEDFGSRYENAAPLSTEQMILSAARKFGVDSELVRAVATAESNLNQAARSGVGAIGVMQLMPETAESLGVNPYDERQNIEGGAHYLRQLLDKFNGNLQNAIAAYNAGPGAVQKYGGVPPYSETQNYVGRVLDFYVR